MRRAGAGTIRTGFLPPLTRVVTYTAMFVATRFPVLTHLVFGTKSLDFNRSVPSVRLSQSLEQGG
mgnify:CR=1 FL=1